MDDACGQACMSIYVCWGFVAGVTKDEITSSSSVVAAAA